VKREYEKPSLRARVYGNEILLKESNITNAKNALAGYGVRIERTTVKKVSELGGSKPE